MATMTRKARGSQSLIDKTKAIFFSSRGFPIILTFTVLAILFVLFRMKGVELDYQVNYINKEIDEISVENKDLKARKARLMSVDKLRDMAKTHGLAQPRQNQIIVIP
mgnify:CR=1 FL=1|tara:strand:+ start:6674 stop:6994 length:321 start_codon:yes stop_codon:yes gene_type:complete